MRFNSFLKFSNTATHAAFSTVSQRVVASSVSLDRVEVASSIIAILGEFSQPEQREGAHRGKSPEVIARGNRKR